MRKINWFNVFQALPYMASSFAGEFMQMSTKAGEMNYNWFTGHLSDIGGAGSFACNALFLLQFSKYRDNERAKIKLVLSYPTIATLLEISKLNPLANTYDPQDIVCFFAGSLMAYGLSKANEKGVFKGLFKKKSLEGAVEIGK